MRTPLDSAAMSPATTVRYTAAAMTDSADLALLPEGLRDDLPPTAEREADIVGRLIAGFQGHGYERVKPPLVEFEESLLVGPGAGISRHMFRLMDPVSQRMMGLRADMTTQVARIAATRLAHTARPLRLCYAGQVLRIRGSQLRPERQFTQAGAELIGVDSVAADAEMVRLAATVMAEVGVGELTIDLTVPALVPMVCADLGLDETAAAMARKALDQRDAPALIGLAATARDRLKSLIDAAGPTEAALTALADVPLPAAGRALLDRVAALVADLSAEGGSGGDFALTLDPGESRGFEYQSGISFALLALGVRGELGRGGRYTLSNGETATGFSLYLDSLLRAVPAPEAVPRLFLPRGQAAAAAGLRRQGWRVVGDLAEGGEAEAEARRLGCTHIFEQGTPRPLSR